MPRQRTPTIALTLAAALAASAAGADDASGLVDQGGDEAAAIQRTLERITLPAGFHIGLFAVVPGARQIAVGPGGRIIFVGTTRSEVWAVSDGDGDGVADEVRPFAPAVAKIVPNGPCFAPDGTLYIAEENRLTAFPDAEAAYDSPDPAAEEIVPLGALVPPDERSSSHNTRVCKVGPDDKLYVSIGQPYNVPPPDKLDLYAKWGIGGIIRMNRDGSGREVYTRGIRNSVGHAFDPRTGDLWFTDNQVDRMGDDIPPGEINHQTAAGQNFGFPWYGGGHTRTHEYADSEPPADVVFPVVETVAHAADLGMMFYTGAMFPPEYANAIFSAQHGSWNRTQPVGARVIVTTFAADGTPDSRPFAEGWIDDDGGYLGRPVDVAQLGDGSILVSDDKAGALYRIWYEAPAD